MTIIYQGSCPSCATAVTVKAEVPEHARKETIPTELEEACTRCGTTVHLRKPLAVDLLAVRNAMPKGGQP